MINNFFNQSLRLLLFPTSWGRLMELSKTLSMTVSREDKAKAAIDWLLEANRQVDQNGFSAHFSILTGWGKPYPETTGYIIQTLLKTKLYRLEDIKSACISSGEWLISIQHPDGSFSGYNTNKPYVFDTAQVIFGLLSLYPLTDNSKYLESAEKAGDWLIKLQEQDGSWVKNSYADRPHSYHSLIALALIQLSETNRVNKYKEAGIKHLDWVVSVQDSEGWIKYSSFFNDEKSVLHTIAYTIQGLLESGIMLGNSKYIKAAQKPADVLLDKWRKDKKISSYLKAGFVAVTSNEQCVTGLAQIAIVWKRLHENTQDVKYLNAATEVLGTLNEIQYYNPKNSWLHGALPGSHPIWGQYMPLTIPNWGIKYYLDLQNVLK